LSTIYPVHTSQGSAFIWYSILSTYTHETIRNSRSSLEIEYLCWNRHSASAAYEVAWVLDFSKDGQSVNVSTAKSFQLWFLGIQKSVTYLGLVHLFSKRNKNVYVNYKQSIIEVSMYAYKLSTVKIILLVGWTGHPTQ